MWARKRFNFYPYTNKGMYAILFQIALLWLVDTGLLLVYTYDTMCTAVRTEIKINISLHLVNTQEVL